MSFSFPKLRTLPRLRKREIKTGTLEKINKKGVAMPASKKHVFVGRVSRECYEDAFHRKCVDNAMSLVHFQKY